MELEELVSTINSLLKSPNLKLPDYRRYITESGTNVAWLRKKLGKRNTSPIVEEVLALLEQHPAARKGR